MSGVAQHQASGRPPGTRSRLSLDQRRHLHRLYVAGIGATKAAREVKCALRTAQQWYEKFGDWGFSDPVMMLSMCRAKVADHGGIAQLCYARGCLQPVANSDVNFCERHTYKPPLGQDLARLMGGRA